MFGLTAKRNITAELHPTSPAADAFRRLRNRMGNLIGGPEGKVIAIVSTSPSEGKTTVAVHLAVACAQTGRKVLLIDGNLRQPALDHIFGLSNLTGLSHLLDQQAEHLAETIQQAGKARLSVLTAGPASETTADALDSVRMENLLKLATAEYELVLIDTPALFSVADAAAIARKSNGVIWVVHAGISRKSAALETKKLLQQLNVPILGCVLNKSVRIMR
jgi:capsular exopolysaccharide synthesis family protein